jgi:hypothetical protein
VRENAQKAAELVGEISSASEEQAKGIREVTEAVSRMDKVTQQTAASAEESAAASEELLAQGAAMRSVMDELQSIVHGASNGAQVPQTQALRSQDVEKMGPEPTEENGLLPTKRFHLPGKKVENNAKEHASRAANHAGSSEGENVLKQF